MFSCAHAFAHAACFSLIRPVVGIFTDDRDRAHALCMTSGVNKLAELLRFRGNRWNNLHPRVLHPFALRTCDARGPSPAQRSPMLVGFCLFYVVLTTKNTVDTQRFRSCYNCCVCNFNANIMQNSLSFWRG